ncbi:MAG: ATP-binding cassette domain-containing protein [Actinomycetota bacterium]|nr:ATP-binding cassette domain-containing protein [Actinomycetota bacterium]
MAAYSAALDRYLALGGDDFEARAAAVCADLGLGGERLTSAMDELSGGQAARAGLAAILLARFDVFLLDEPTNDLDFAGLDLLEGFLAGLDGGVVVVSHDRAFLDRSVTRMVELQEESHRAVEFAGAWTDYVAARALSRRQQDEAFRRYREQKQQLNERIRTQRTWSEKGLAAAKRKPKDNDRARRGATKERTEKQAAKVRASEHRLERLERVERIDKPWQGWQLKLDLSSGQRSGDVVVRLAGAVVRRGPFVLGPVDLEIGWAERVAVLGPNGSGKSTLLRAMLGELPLDGGSRWAGPSVAFGQLDQRRAGLDRGGPSVLANFVRATGMLAGEARSLLAKFGLGTLPVSRSPAALSPGERTRVILAALMAGGANCLVLDEPTNHLDLPAIEQLEEALDAFEGTLVCVSHDRWLLESVRFDRTLVVDRGAVEDGTVASPVP